jgi:glycosyltransferase involved in cell wall biosynthesis
MSKNRLRVLIVAHEFSPFRGSEAAVGWNIVTRLSQYHDVTVFYASGSHFWPHSYVDEINRYFTTAAQIPGLTIINIDHPRIYKLYSTINKLFAKLSPVGLPVLYYLAYQSWQKAVFNQAKRLHKINKFNIVHQLTQVSYREPGYLWKLGVPFFWGPTGGTLSPPKDFDKILSLQSKILSKIRSFSNIVQFNFSSRIIKANKKASVIYAFTNGDAVRLKKRAGGQVKIMLDVGTAIRSSLNTRYSTKSETLKGIWCGRLDDYKAPEILLKAISLNTESKEKIKFKIVGSGPLKDSLIKMAVELKLNNIEWISHVKHEEIFELMLESDFFIHTSIREATSSVIPEAFSVGLPVICHDAYGMGIAVTETCGIKIPMISPEQSIIGFNGAMVTLISDRDLLERLKTGAAKRSEEISWDKMAALISNDYLDNAKMQL